MKTHHGLASLACGLALAALSAQVPLHAAAPSAVAGIATQRLQGINRFVEGLIAKGEISGAVTLVARDGRIVHLQAQGVTDLVSRQPMRTDTLMRIASMTKPIVAVSVLMLVEEGKIRLDDPVSRFIPAFKDAKVAVTRGATSYAVPVERPLTITDLLTHTGGLVSGPVSTAAAAPVMDRRRAEGIKALDDLASVPLEFQPGTRWAYSGLAGFELLARIVEIASGQRYGASAQIHHSAGRWG